MKHNRNLKRGCSIALLLYFVFAVAFYHIGGEQLKYRQEQTDAGVSATETIGELIAGVVVTQPFEMDSDTLCSIAVLAANYDAPKTGFLRVRILDGEQLLAETAVNAADIVNNEPFTLFSGRINGVRGRRLTLEITAPDAVTGQAVTFWMGNTFHTGRVELKKELDDALCAKRNGQSTGAQLCYTLTGTTRLLFGQYYWYLVGALGLLLALYCLWLLRETRHGRQTAVLRVIDAFQRYHFLLQQLILRDFKTKYKRSILGIFWSFLNPLLTMLVQYLVFSTIFQSDIPNFIIYLLSGIICFNFFNEALALGLTSIVSNAALITKVYMPKYMYPFSRVLSSAINFLLSLLPLFIMLLLTGTRITSAALLLPFAILCLLMLCIGMALLLSTLMVFFHDTQFLWGVLSMLWMYATPIFYPESIIPAHLMPIFKINPLYHVIRFTRTILIDGISPEPKAYLLCLIACVVPLLIGIFTFKKNQDRFVLYI